MKYVAKSQIYINVFNKNRKTIEESLNCRRVLVFDKNSILYMTNQLNIAIQIYHKHFLFILKYVINHVQSDEISNEKIMKRKCNDYNYIRNKFRLLNTTHTNSIVL